MHDLPHGRSALAARTARRLLQVRSGPPPGSSRPSQALPRQPGPRAGPAPSQAAPPCPAIRAPCPHPASPRHPVRLLFPNSRARLAPPLPPPYPLAPPSRLHSGPHPWVRLYPLVPASARRPPQASPRPGHPAPARPRAVLPGPPPPCAVPEGEPTSEQWRDARPEAWLGQSGFLGRPSERAGGEADNLPPVPPRFATLPGGRTETPRASVSWSRLGRRACPEPPASVPGPQGPRAPRVQTQPVERPGDSGVDLFGVTLTPALRLSRGHESLRPRPTASRF